MALFEVFTAPKVRELPPLAPLPAAARRAGVDLARDLDRGRDLRAQHRVFLNVAQKPVKQTSSAAMIAVALAGERATRLAERATCGP